MPIYTIYTLHTADTHFTVLLFAAVQCIGVCIGSCLSEMCVYLFSSFSTEFWGCCREGDDDSNLVDPASSHMLVSKIKPCMSKYKLLYGETANGSLKQL